MPEERHPQAFASSAQQWRFRRGRAILDIKAVNHLNEVHKAQLINDPEATGYTGGRLPDFGTLSLTHRRMVYNRAG